LAAYALAPLYRHPFKISELHNFSVKVGFIRAIEAYWFTSLGRKLGRTGEEAEKTKGSMSISTELIGLQLVKRPQSQAEQAIIN
jgi:hypothetical protein